MCKKLLLGMILASSIAGCGNCAPTYGAFATCQPDCKWQDSDLFDEHLTPDPDLARSAFLSYAVQINNIYNGIPDIISKARSIAYDSWKPGNNISLEIVTPDIKHYDLVLFSNIY